MNARGARWTLLAGVLLILVANAVVLAGVAWNRSGAPEAVLRLGTRELRVPYSQAARVENSGMLLRLQWRVPTTPAADARGSAADGIGASPAWLDEDRIAALGFEIPREGDVAARRLALARQLSRDVLLVLEFDGPAYRRAVDHARQQAELAEARSRAEPGAADLKRRAEWAANRLRRAETIDSRLFVVDAGLDAAALRAVWPDASRHAIVEGRVRAALVGPDETARVGGYVSGLNVPAINVPSGARAALERALAASGARRKAGQPIVPGLEIEVAFGRRFEPWIRSVTSAGTGGASAPGGRSGADSPEGAR
ncbi:DUF4824 family protein [Burkholderiaceae bacterium FT117]|uniref:DUF4824 family protein n=1 Tax=Zeimonas sediminis TaxID=2944268 RepID=UPI002342D884|nr:DUF4824 family protein [Zeimonas sediminis]MCM5569707.1 DUF4824 family protein [Zeimonas sediminis]